MPDPIFGALAPSVAQNDPAAQAPSDGSLQPMPPGALNYILSKLIGGAAQSVNRVVTTPGRVMAPNPYPAGSEEASWYDDQRSKAVGDWAPEAAASVMGGSGVVPAEANSLRMGIKAYHGSPHDFDAFSLDKIGTGEGAQAYGHGLYFAENEGVAKGYRDQLANLKTPDGTMGIGDADWHLAQAASKASDIPQGKADLLSTNFTEAIRGGHSLDDLEQHFLNGLKPDDPMYKATKAVAAKAREFRPNPGHMYEVNINAGPEHFLDWDKPLSEQPPKVKEILSSVQLPQGVDKDAVQRALAGNETPYDRDWNPTTGAALYRQIAKAPKNDPNAAASQLAQAGIPGIKYLDQGSRAAGDGSRNYVVFNDKLIDILRKYGLAGLPAAGVAASAVTQNSKTPTGILSN